MSAIIALTDPQSRVTEAYRILRTNLLLAMPGQAMALAVTAPGAEEDKSTVLANLAVVLAQTGRAVVVADCDLRRPMQHRLFELGNEEGMATLLAGDGPIAPSWRETPVPGLRVIPSGPTPPNPAELLSSRRFGDVLANLTAAADVVLLDVPPVLPVADAAIVASQVGAAVLVLTSGRSRRDLAQRARETLDAVGARLVGVVLTGVAPEFGGYPAYGREASA